MVRDVLPVIFGLVFAQHYFEFQEVPESLDLIDVNARLASEIKRAGLLDDSDHTQRSAQDIVQDLWIGRARD